MDVQLHPRFADNKLVYLTYHKPQAPAPPERTAAPPAPAAGGRGNALPPGVITLARGRWDGSKLVDVKDIFSAVPSGNASRIIFGRDGMIYMSIGYGDPPVGNPNPTGMPPQDPMSLDRQDAAAEGRRHRAARQSLRGQGGLPRGNLHARSPQHPRAWRCIPPTGAIWSVENGPNGGDEVNELQPGRNYGWPVVSYGRFYLGPRVSVNPYKEGMEPPTVYWVPAIAASGLVFYTGDRLPQWKNHLFVGGMRQGEVPRSGHLERVDFNEQWEELHREGMLRELQQRIRDVRQGPDGLLYLLTAENDGALLEDRARRRPARNEHDRLARRAPARAPRSSGPPGDARVPRRDVGASRRRGRLRAGLHERLRGVGRAPRHARHRAHLVRRAGRPGAEHLPRRVDPADRRRRHRLRQRPEREAHRGRLRARRLCRHHARGPGGAEALRSHRGQVGGAARRGAHPDSRRRGRAQRGRRHPHHGAHRRPRRGQPRRGHRPLPGVSRAWRRHHVPRSAARRRGDAALLPRTWMARRWPT